MPAQWTASTSSCMTAMALLNPLLRKERAVRLSALRGLILPVMEKALDPHLAAIGEISLAGEIRAVAGAPQRAAEGARLGYTSIVDASAVHVREAVRLAFASAADEGPRSARRSGAASCSWPCPSR